MYDVLDQYPEHREQSLNTSLKLENRENHKNSWELILMPPTHFLVTQFYRTYKCGNQLHTPLISAVHKVYIQHIKSAEGVEMNIYKDGIKTKSQNSSSHLNPFSGSIEPFPKSPFHLTPIC